MADLKEVEAILGPHRGNRLTMTAADAESAINDHWAIDPFKGLNPEGQHTEGEPLSEEERTHALEAAKTWAAAQVAAASGETPPDPPPEGGATRKRAVTPDETPSYKTRGR